MRLIVVAGLSLALAACGAPPETGPAENGAAAPPAAEPQPQPAACNPADHQSLVGQNVAAVSFPAGANVRVVCTTCPMTRDYRPDRLNVLFNQETGIIEQVTCG